MPTGVYNLYSYSFGSNLNDYPKIGVGPTSTKSAYMATYNLFAVVDPLSARHFVRMIARRC